MTLVNGRGFTLEAPCERGVLGLKCSMADYVSWRPVAVDLRNALLTATYGVDEHTSLGKQVAGWLTAWVSSDIADSMIEYSLAWKESLNMGDPEIDRDDGQRFPPDPRPWLGEWSPTEIVTYTSLTKELVQYTREGWRLFKKTRAARIPMIVGDKLEAAESRGEDKPAGWVRPAIAVGVTGTILAFGTWIYTSILRARKGDQV